MLAASVAGVGCTRAITGSGGTCTLNSDCDALLVCAASLCRPQCRVDRDCGGGETCRGVGGTAVCVPPSSPVPCAYSSQCGDGLACVAGTCRMQCATDRDCMGGACSAGSCTAPIVTPPIGGDGGVDAGGDPGCTGGTQLCSDTHGGMICTDVGTDFFNCGTCGYVCEPGMVCRGGLCYCDAPHTQCASLCPDLADDSMNCGSCGHSCEATEICTHGNCCAFGSAFCGSACLDVQNDDANCGDCGVACTGGTRCNRGMCLAANDECSGAIPIVLGAGPATVGVPAGTDASGSDGTCDPETDVWYSITLSRREIVALEVTSGRSAYVGLRTGGCGAPALVCGLSCLHTAITVLEPGTYPIVVDLDPGSSTELTVVHVPVGEGVPVDVIPSVSASYHGTLSGLDTPGTCGTGPEHVYVLDGCVTTGSATLVASTCGGATFDTILSTTDGATTAVCRDDDPACAPRSTTRAIPVGSPVFVTIEGKTPTDVGDYTLDVTLTP